MSGIIEGYKLYGLTRKTSTPCEFRGGGNLVSSVNNASGGIPQLCGPDKDVVEISSENKKNEDKKQGLSKAQKWCIGIGGAVVSLGVAAFLIFRHQTNRIKKLYDENMVFTELLEHIDFKEAKTVDEGISFAKNVLKIGEVDKDFTLDAINFANKGLVEAANANKGKLFMPKKIYYRDMGKDTLAGVIKEIQSPHFGSLSINKKYFENETLDKYINNCLGIRKKEAAASAVKAASSATAKAKDDFGFTCRVDNNILDMIKRYKKAPESLTIAEKREIMANLEQAITIQSSLLKLSPMTTLKNNRKLFEKYGIQVDLKEFEALSTEKQSEKIKDLFSQLQEKVGGKLLIKIPYLSPTGTIHHEMGHLQDFAKNLKELDIKNMSFGDVWSDVKGGKYTVETDFVGNRWGGMTYNGFSELFKKNPKKFQKRYPDLYEFLTNQEFQQSAGKISAYAQTSIGEFIAETYGKMVRGEKVADDVMYLYKKYNGPMIPYA